MISITPRKILALASFILPLICYVSDADDTPLFQVDDLPDTFNYHPEEPDNLEVSFDTEEEDTKKPEKDSKLEANQDKSEQVASPSDSDGNDNLDDDTQVDSNAITAPFESKTFDETKALDIDANAVTIDFGKEEKLESQKGDVILNDNDLISIDFPEEQIRTILRNIAELFDLNLIIPDTLVGSSSIKLRNVEWRQVFDIILKPVGFTFTEEKNIIRVVSVDEVNREPMMIKTFPIRYAKATDIAKSLQPLIQTKDGGKIEVDKRSNAIIVKDRPSIMLQIEELLRDSGIDRPSLQVMIEAKFVELSEEEGGSDQEGLGIDFWTQAGPFGGNPSAGFGTDAKLNMTGTLPNPPSTVATGTTAGALATTLSSITTHLKTAVFSARRFDLVINALKTNTNSELIANPTVVILNNETAEFHVGRNEPIIESRFNDNTGTYEAGQVDYLPVGVRVEVTPQVNPGADQITLDVKPKVSRILSFREAFGVSYPVETIRETQTHVSIKNGYTLALGGLIQDDQSEVVRKIPVIGDLPLIGRIFRNESRRSEKTNLIMFITARTLNPDGSTYQEVVDPRQMQYMGISPYDVPGYGNGIDVPGIRKMSEEHHCLLNELQDMREALKQEEAVCRTYLENAETYMKLDTPCEDYTRPPSKRKCRRRRF